MPFLTTIPECDMRGGPRAINKNVDFHFNVFVKVNVINDAKVKADVMAKPIVKVKVGVKMIAR